MSLFNSTLRGNPHALQRRLLVILLGSLTTVAVLLGLLYNAGVRQTLMAQLNEQLYQTAARAAAYSDNLNKPGDKLFAPGQGPGTLTARYIYPYIFSGAILDDSSGERVEITQADTTPLVTLKVGDEPVRKHLSIGDYLLLATKDPGSGGTLIVGLPLHTTDAALLRMSWLTLFIALFCVLGAGLAGSWWITRSFAPLKRVASVAASVASEDLKTGTVAPMDKVSSEDAIPGTEVGNVGWALNAMIDNVSTALTAREKSQAQMRQFVADASHELRTPLAAIRGYTELLSATEHFSEDGRRSVDRVLQQSNRMSTLVENLLLLARLDEREGFTLERVDLGLLTADITEDFKITATEHNWDFECQAEELYVDADAASLRRVITNLLANARKHTSAGNTVTVTVARDAATDQAIVRVHDTGEGIDEDFLPRVFERFTRADTARSGSDGTTGLGLPIAKSIVEAHSGTITVSSRPGDTTFEVRLPVASGPTERSTGPASTGPARN
ncbi:sensor histidine kinase [Glutamicibacter endophyticus]|uniref:sensor histidine kinase n=1 Tax=Glutamicibacter endophyticus TaxID=1522174 RepID=UPI003AF0B5C7